MREYVARIACTPRIGMADTALTYDSCPLRTRRVKSIHQCSYSGLQRYSKLTMAVLTWCAILVAAGVSSASGQPGALEKSDDLVVGGCGGTQYGCCEGEDLTSGTAKKDTIGSNCEGGACGLGFICPEDVEELCGLDGKTYKNKCEAYCAGTRRDFSKPPGACASKVAERYALCQKMDNNEFDCSNNPACSFFEENIYESTFVVRAVYANVVCITMHLRLHLP